MGLEPGEPDWEIISGGRVYKIEIKGDGPTSAIQKKVHQRLELAGAFVVTDIRTLDQFIAQVHAWKIPLLHHPRRDAIDMEDIGI